MNSQAKQNKVLIALAATLLVWIVGQLFAGKFFDNGWSFQHWSVIPVWYICVWGLLLAASILIVLRYDEKLSNYSPTDRATLILFLLVASLIAFFHIESITLGAGNLRIAQIAQAPVIVFRWFEFGSIALVSQLYSFYSLFESNNQFAAGYAWRTLAFASSIASVLAAIKISELLDPERKARVWLIVILFFGPQSLLMAGFIGIGPLNVAITLWFFVAALNIDKRPTVSNLLFLWAITFLGIISHYTMVYLLPAALYLTIGGSSRNRKSQIIGLILSLLSIVALIVLLYRFAGESFEFAQKILFTDGRQPFLDYYLQSSRHIGDLLQLFFLLAPLILVAKFALLRKLNWLFERPSRTAVYVCAISGTLVITILNPLNSIVSDLPLLAAYLTPYAVLFAMMSAPQSAGLFSTSRVRIGVALFSVLLFMAYYPVYKDIDITADYTERYFDKHDAFHRIGDAAFRDAFFYQRKLDKANEWQAKLPIKSTDYLKFRGSSDLAYGGELNDALTVLQQLITRNPSWVEPRELAASLYLQKGQFKKAKPQIDTLLMLKPYRRTGFLSLIRYYQANKEDARALSLVTEALRYFPDDKDFLTDRMFISFRLGAVEDVESIASQLLELDSTLARPHLARGYLNEQKGDFERALEEYKMFVSMAPKDPEAQMIMERITKLRSLIK